MNVDVCLLYEFMIVYMLPTDKHVPSLWRSLKLVSTPSSSASMLLSSVALSRVRVAIVT